MLITQAPDEHSDHERLQLASEVLRNGTSQQLVAQIDLKVAGFAFLVHPVCCASRLRPTKSEHC
ncbi:MAG TPA: hypothetical protein PLB25_11160, partial [Rhodoferax sp.]|nr:hypothetical protein [Rhodoferax sp.]